MFGIVLRPYKHEVIPHWLGRHVTLFYLPNSSTIIERLTGKRHRGFSGDLPTRLERLARAMSLPENMDVDYLIENHTHFRYYANFLPQSRVEYLRELMKGELASQIHLITGAMPSNISLHKNYMVCLNCFNYEESIAEAYIHLEHQIPNVFLCPHHGIELFETNIPINQLIKKYELFTVTQSEISLQPPKVVISDHIYKYVYMIAKDSLWLLETPIAPKGLDWIRQKYLQLLIHNDLATYSGRIRAGDLISQFLTFYPFELLSLLGCALDTNSNDNWLLRLVRKPRAAQHPIYHLLLINFLDVSLEDFFFKDFSNAPFGPGPWPCLNATCLRYKHRIICGVDISYSKQSGTPVGAFSCPHCNFAYSRMGPDQCEEDQFRRSRIVSFGKLWESVLINHWTAKKSSLRQMARILGVDPRTVQRQAAILELTHQAPYKLHVLNEADQDQSLIEEDRQKWQLLVQANPTFTKTSLRQLEPALYMQLYRKDRDWLNQNSPLKKVLPQTASRFVDWETRDLYVAVKCCKAIIDNLDFSRRPTRLTKTWIRRHSGFLTLLERHFERMEISTTLIFRFVENREENAIRRIWWTTKHNKLSSNLNLTRWKLIKESGTERLMHHSEVSNALDSAIKWFNTSDHNETHSCF